ncbi:MAG: methyltransferase domain-containing protein [Lentisphaeraceae bacterium]|nr:methyltransferase domain-containing protein [Lentisphaeraceae bacterium]
MHSVKESVQNYYSEVLKSSQDLKTSACCAGGEPPQWMKVLISNIDDKVLDKFYGCGFPVTEAVGGATVVDLGCGSGRDVYIYSQLVGEHGQVIGVDMTDTQLATAREVLPSQMERFGYSRNNVDFLSGYIEQLSELGIQQNSVDLVVSNCVVNLSPDKKAVIEGVFDILKEGGEFYFSDVFCDRRLSDELRRDEMLYGECLGGALYVNDFIALAKSAGFKDPRLVSEGGIELEEDVKALTGTARFTSRTYRLFKLPTLESNCEDYGEVAVYKGSIKQAPHIFKLDDHHAFEVGRPERVCGNTADMLQLSRFKEHFDLHGSRSVHYGEFVCGNTIATDQYSQQESGEACC